MISEYSSNLELCKHYENSLFKYIENFITTKKKKKKKISVKKYNIFHISAKKHRLWVLVKIASVRWF